MNWPPTSLCSRIPSPIEVEGGLLFHPENWSEAEACMKRMQENGHDVQILTEPRDLGVFVEVLR